MRNLPSPDAAKLAGGLHDALVDEDAEACGKRFDMNVARPEFNGLFQEIIDRAHDGRAAGRDPAGFRCRPRAVARQSIAARLGAAADKALVKLRRFGGALCNLAGKHRLKNGNGMA